MRTGGTGRKGWWLALAALLLAVTLVWFWWRRDTPAAGGEGGAAAGGAAAAPGTATRGAAAAAGSGTGGAGGDAAEAERPIPRWYGQPGAPARRVAGRVISDGKPLAGAEVRLLNALTRAGVWTVPTARTGPDGRFDFGSHVAAPITLGAIAPDHAAAVVQVDLRDPTARPPPDQIEIVLEGCESRVSGTVRDAAGVPITGAAIRLARTVGVDTGADGRYELCVAPGFVELVVEAAGYGGVMLGMRVTGRMVRDVVLVPEGGIAGRVVRRDGGAPVADAIVDVFPFEFGRERPAPALAATDAEGQFRTGGLNPGRYRLLARAEGMGSEQPVEALVRAGETSEGHVIELIGLGQISGRVRAGARAVAGAAVQAQRKVPMARSLEMLSQEDGSFVIPRVPLGEVQLLVRDHEVLSPPSVKVEAAELRGVVVEVAPMASISGTVTRLGKPVPGANVAVAGVGRGARTVADADARYTLRGLRGGEHKLIADSIRAGAYSDTVTVTVAEGEDKTGVDIELFGGATITGTVVDQHGKPVVGARVLFTHLRTADVGSCFSEVDGAFVCDSMSGGGEYRPQVFPASELAAPFPPAGGAFSGVTLADGNARVDGVRLAILNETKTISGRVVSSGGPPVADARVVAQVMKPGQEPVFRSWEPLPATRSDADGSFTLQGLTVGTYAVRAIDADGAEGLTVGVSAGDRNVLVTVQRKSGIRGKLVGYRTPVPVYVSTAGDASFKFMPATVSGPTFRIDGLTPGAYVVSAQSLEEGDVALVEVRAGEMSEVTLENHGSGTLEGTLVEAGSGKPLSGFTCHTVLRAGAFPGITNWNVETAPRTDAQGRFVVARAPAGEVYTDCFGSRTHATASAAATVPAGGKVTVSLQAVRTVNDRNGSIGLSLHAQSSDLHIVRLDPGGPAQRAGLEVGDLVVSVDGVDARSLGAQGVMQLIRNHEVGSTVTVVVKRGAENRVAKLQVVLGED